jgi:NAD(P)-dependent dehydrogenase (short-subunit alcohol dehydrogenase family)
VLAHEIDKLERGSEPTSVDHVFTAHYNIGRKRTRAQMASYLITGASRGIGLELTRQLLGLPASQVGKVIALTRSNKCPSLTDLLGRYPDRAFHIVASVDDNNSVQKAAAEVKSRPDPRGLDCLSTTLVSKPLRQALPRPFRLSSSNNSSTQMWLVSTG